jgi:hypothetical protein
VIFENLYCGSYEVIVSLLQELEADDVVGILDRLVMP